MQVVDILKSAQGGHAVENLARAFNLSPDQAAAVLDAVVPQLSGAIERNTLSRGGLADLVKALGQGHHEQILDNPAALGRADVRQDGEAVLGHLLGSKDRSCGVAAQAALSSGVSATLIKLMLPYIASMLMGGLSKYMKGGLGDILGRMGGALPGPQGGGAGGSMQMPELPRMPQGGGLGGGTGGGFGIPMPQGFPGGPSGNVGGGTGTWGGGGGGIGGGGSPLPLPGDTVPGIPGNSGNPYGDLSDILRRGMGLPGGSGGAGGNTGGGNMGGGIPLPMPSPGGGGVSIPNGNVGGGMLWQIVRGILGTALGFQGRGLMGWLFRMIFMKFGWGLLRTIFGRVLMGR